MLGFLYKLQGKSFLFLLIAFLLTMPLLGHDFLFAGPRVTSFIGGSSADVLKTPGWKYAFSPRRLKEREFLEGYSFWMSLNDGSVIIGSLIISNLGKPLQPAMTLSIYSPNNIDPTKSKKIEGHQEYPSETLKIYDSIISFDKNSFERLNDGRYKLKVFLPLRANAKEHISAEFVFTPVFKEFKRGDGFIHYGDKHFEMVLLFPKAKVEGFYTLGGNRVNVSGNAYGDHTSQNLWAHYVANSWFNYRFFSDEMFIASTSLKVPPKYGSSTINHIIVADSSKIWFSDDKNHLEYQGGSIDNESGYKIPQRVISSITHGDTNLKISIPSEQWLDRIYLLEHVNPILRAFLRLFIAKPYVYRYNQPAKLIVTQANNKSEYIGKLVAEMIFVND